MNDKRILLSIGMFALLAPPAYGQVVQLPSYRVFSTNTTVSVPDRGHLMIGGVDRSRVAGASRTVPILGRLPGTARLFGGYYGAGSMGTSRAYVKATVIDHAELDRVVRAEGAARLRHESDEDWIEKKAAFLARHVDRTDKVVTQPAAGDTRPRQSANEAIHRGHNGRRIARSGQDEAAQLYERGQRALADKRVNAARVYFRIASRKAEGTLREQILSSLEAVPLDASTSTRNRHK